MNVYRIKATHYREGEAAIATFYVIAPRLPEALDLWHQEKLPAVDDEPESVVCLGKAILAEGRGA